VVRDPVDQADPADQADQANQADPVHSRRLQQERLEAAGFLPDGGGKPELALQ
jgi:hypothetical protein